MPFVSKKGQNPLFLGQNPPIWPKNRDNIVSREPLIVESRLTTRVDCIGVRRYIIPLRQPEVPFISKKDQNPLFLGQNRSFYVGTDERNWISLKTSRLEN